MSGAGSAGDREWARTYRPLLYLSMATDREVPFSSKITHVDTGARQKSQLLSSQALVGVEILSGCFCNYLGRQHRTGGVLFQSSVSR